MKKAVPTKTDPGIYETSTYRCLVDGQKQTDVLYLIFCGVERCLPGYEFHAEDREGYHLHVILSGKGVLSVNGAETELRFGQMFVTKPGEQTWYRADEEDPWTYCWMAYDGINALRYTEAAGFRPGVNWRNCNVEPNHFYHIVKRVLDQPELNLALDLMHIGLLAEYLSLAIQSEYKSEQTPRREAVYSTDMYVDYAIKYINANFATAKIGDVADYIGIHRSYLASIFKQKTGVSPQEYLMQLRMRIACTFLLRSNLSIQEIAQRVGYDNSLTFSKVFKAYCGASPKHFRQSRLSVPETPAEPEDKQDKENTP